MKVLRFFTGMAVFIFMPLAACTQNLQLADSLNQRGMDFYKTGQYRQSEFYLGEAFKIYKEKAPPSVWLSPGVDYAEILVDRSQYKKALELLKELQVVANELSNLKARARIKNDLGWTYNKTGEIDRALDHYKQAIPLARQANDTLRLGYIYNNIGSIYLDQGNYQSSLKYRKKSLSILSELNNDRIISIALNNIGLIYKKLSLYDRALEYYQRSLSIRKKIGNTDLLATAHDNTAGLYKEIGQYDQALTNYQKSLEYALKAGNPSKTATTLNNIGTLYNKLGQPDRALEFYQESLEVKKSFAGPSSLSVSYSNIASRLWDLGRYEESTDYYKQALKLRKQAGNSVRVASTLLDLSLIELAKNNVETASKYLHEATALTDSTQSLPVQLRIKMQEGDIFHAKQNLQKALDSYKKAKNIAQQISPTDQIWPLHRLAFTYDQMDSSKAISTARQAIAIIEKSRSKTGPLSQFKAGYFKQHVDFYIELASWVIKYNQDYAGAYKLVESAKARSLTDELAAAAQRIDEALPEKKRLKRAQQISELSGFYTSLNKASSPESKAEIKKKIRTKELAYASFENRLQQAYPQYKHLKSPDPVTLNKVQAMLDEETALLEYAITNSGLMLTFFITRNGVQTKQVSINNNRAASDSSSYLSTAVLQFRNAIISRASEDSLRKLSTPIYNQLIAPFEKDLEAFENLIIVPDGFLAYLPFDALNTNDNYLVNQFNVKYAPSMTSFSLISKPDAPAIDNILTIANAGRYSTVENNPALPTVNIEVETISELFSHTTILKDADVTEENVKKHIQQKYSIVHIAAHSVINEKNSSQSGIVLHSNNNRSMGNDGYLRNTEIYRLNIPGDMVVLSACKSGIGQMINGEGMLGLQRAFFNAGASSVVVSLWDVYDRSTTHFMQLFYKSLINASDNRTWSDSWQALLRWSGWDTSEPFGYTASSMRKAKLKMLKHPKYHHPVYWAPFISVGR